MNTAGKSDHQLTLEQLLRHVVDQLERLNTSVSKDLALHNLSRSTTDLSKQDNRIESRSTHTLQASPLAKMPENKVSYSVTAEPKQRITKQASVAPLKPAEPLPLSPAATKALKGAQYDFVPWFIREFCRQNKGRTIACRAVSELSALQHGRYPATELALVKVSKYFPDVFKIVKTSIYEDATFAGNEIIIQPADNPTNKRLSAVRVF